MNKRYVVRLQAEERERLEQLVKVGKVAGYKIRHANMLLMADADGPAMAGRQVSKALGMSVEPTASSTPATCSWTRRRQRSGWSGAEPNP